MTYSCVIVEDDPHALRHLSYRMDTHAPRFAVVGAAASVYEAILLIEKKRPDLVLLDIALGEESGFSLLAHFEAPTFEVVVVTGFDQYAVEALRRNAVDYLLKPVDEGELASALNRVEKKRMEKGPGRSTPAQKLADNWYMLVAAETMLLDLPSAGVTRYVKPRDIILMETSKGYTRFYLQNGEQLLITRSLNSFELKLQGLGFIRCHQSSLVNRMYVIGVRHENGIMDLELSNGRRVLVSRNHHKLTKAALPGL